MRNKPARMKMYRIKKDKVKKDKVKKDKIKKQLLLAAAGAILLFAGCANASHSKQPKPERAHTEHKEDTGAKSETEAGQDLQETASQENSPETAAAPDGKENPPETATLPDSQDTGSLVRPEGMSLAQRFAVPDGFRRTKAKEGSLLAFLRNYPVKKDKSPVRLYDGTLKTNQNSHAAVFKLPIEQEDLQQCADSVIRVYAEYFWQTGQYGRIAFHFVNGFYAEYTKWRDGFRIQVNGNDVVWEKTAGYDDSYENFQKYLRIVFSYAGTLSMEAESKAIVFRQIRAGDILIRGASPGHVVMVVDLCKDAEGKKAFLLAQGYMPAQEFHVLKNPLHEDDPWYYEQEAEYPFFTPEYTFLEGSLRRLDYQ